MFTSGCASWIRATPSGAAISETSETLVAPALLEHVDRVRGRVAGREHRVEQEHVALGDVGGELDVVLDRLERLLVSVEADEADPRDGDEREDAVEHAHPRSEDRADRHLLARDPVGLRPLERGLDLDLLDSHLLRRLVGEQERQLVDEPAEHLGVGVDVAEQAELVPDERVGDLVDGHYATYVV